MEFPVLWSVLCNLIWFGGDKCLETLARPSYSRNWRVNKPFIILKHILASQSILVLEKKSLGRLPFLSIGRRQRPVRNCNASVWPRRLCSWRKTSLVKRSSLTSTEGTRHICRKVVLVGRPVLTNGKRPLFPYNRIEIEHWWSRRFCGNRVGKLRDDCNRLSTFYILIWITDALFLSYGDVLDDREDYMVSRLLQCHHFFQANPWSDRWINLS